MYRKFMRFFLTLVKMTEEIPPVEKSFIWNNEIMTFNDLKWFQVVVSCCQWLSVDCKYFHCLLCFSSDIPLVTDPTSNIHTV